MVFLYSRRLRRLEDVYVRALITRKILRSKDAQRIT